MTTANPIKTYAQARTAKQYLEILFTEMMDDEIPMPILEDKQSKAEGILLALEDFHQHNSIRLVVNNG